MNSAFTRRTVMAGGASLLALASLGDAKAQGKPKLQLSLAPTETDLRAEGYKAFAAAMKEDFELEPYWNNTLFKQGTELVALQRENLQLCNLAPADISKQLPAWSLLTSAYLFRDYTHLKKTFQSNVGQDFIKMARDKLGIEVIRPVYFGARQVNLKPDKKINTPADMAGIKLRMPPGEFWQFLGESIGANPTPVAFAEPSADSDRLLEIHVDPPSPRLGSDNPASHPTNEDWPSSRLTTARFRIDASESRSY